MSVPRLSVTINHAQPRIKRDRQWVVCSGMQFNGDEAGRFWADTWIDPICHRTFLRPGPMYEAWATSNAGIFHKFAKADFTFATPAKWLDGEDVAGAGGYIVSQGINEVAVLTTPVAKNQAMWLELFAHSDGAVHSIGQFGYGTSLADGVAWEAFSDGSIDCYKNGRYLITKKMSQSSSDKPLKQAQGAEPIANEKFGMMIIPNAYREILFCTREGRGFSYCYQDIDEADAHPTITPAGHFWVNIPAPTSAHFQLALLQFASSGYVVSETLSFPEDPTGLDGPFAYVGGESGKFYSFTDYGAHAAPTFSLLNHDASAPFLPVVGGDLRCRIRVDLAGAASFSPVVYGIECYFKAEAASTNGAEAFVLDPYITSAHLEVPEQREGTTVSLEIKTPQTLDAGSARGLLSGYNVPVQVKIGNIVILDGVIAEVVWHSEIGDEVQRASVKIRDYFKLLEDYLFQDIKVLDGLPLETALAFVLKRVGLPDADFLLEATGLTLGQTPSSDADDWNVEISTGKKASGELTELIDDQAAGWFARFVPKSGAPRPPFVFKSPTTMSGEAPALKIFGNRDGAIAGLPLVDATDIWKYLYRKFEHGKIEPEANDLRVTWLDPRDGRIGYVRRFDEAASDPTTLPSARPPSWTGDIRRAGLITGRITNKDLATAACNYLYDRLTKGYQIGGVDCEMLFWPTSGPGAGRPVWVGDKLDTDQFGVYTVCALSAHFYKEPNEDMTVEPDSVQWRESHYVLGDGSGNLSGGSTMRTILDANRLRAALGQKMLVRPGWDHLIDMSPKQIVKLPA